jgi:hypothetical protein
MEVWVTYENWVTPSQKEVIRNNYAVVAGLITYDTIGGKEIWTVNEAIWNSYTSSDPTGGDDLGDDLEDLPEIKEVEEQP